MNTPRDQAETGVLVEEIKTKEVVFSLFSFY